MIEGLYKYYNELHSSRLNSVVGEVPDKDTLVSKVRDIEDNLNKYHNCPLVRFNDFYVGYINGLCDSLVLSGWDPWLVHSFIHTYLIVKYTNTYLTYNKSNNWRNSLAKSLNDYYDSETIELIMTKLQVVPEWTN